MDFVQLHLHTYFSILDGIASPEECAKKAAESGMKALAITDHGSMSGIWRFYVACKKEGIKPIIGCELYVNNKRDRREAKGNSHIVLLVKNKTGYKNLLKINYDSMDNGFYYRGRTTDSFVFNHSKGLIATTACMGSKISRYILDGKKDKAESLFLKYKNAFGSDFYGELIFNELNDQIKVTREIYRLCEKHRVKWIVTGDIHYLEKGDEKVQDMLLMINTKKRISDENVFRFSARHLYFHTSEDYYDFNDRFGFNLDEDIIKKGLENTLEVADKCSFQFEDLGPKFPSFINDDGHKVDSIELLKKKCWRGLNRLGNLGEKAVVYMVRLEKELSVICSRDFADYFLIIEDIISFCKESNIAIGAGRGSAAGSLVSYVLGITRIDPIKHGLLFERFLNKDRKDPPDIDLDFESDRKHEIEKYLKSKYGSDRVAHIITFGTLRVRGAIRDTARVLEKDNDPEFKEIIKKIIDNPAKSVDKYSLVQQLKEVPWSDSERAYLKKNKDMFKMAGRIVGKIRQPGRHAGGVAITPGPLFEYIPVYKVKGEIVTGLTEGNDYRELSDLGILKIDILAIDQVDILKKSVELALEIRGDEINLDYIDLEDDKLFEAFREERSLGIFQFENVMIDNFLKRVKPECFEDIVTVNALYRPALINAGEHERYIKRRDKIKAWERRNNKKYKPKDQIGKILASTYGVIVFQEQFMEILHRLGEFTLEEADKARKTFKILYLRRQNTELKKKDPELLKVTNKFRKGALKTTNLSEDQIETLIDRLAEFAEYAFNRSHAVSYSIVSMQTMFIREYYPQCFYSALLSRTPNSVMSYGIRKENKTKKYVRYITKRGIGFLPVDINKSGTDFFPEGNKIRLPLTFIPGIGSSLAKSMVAAAPFSYFLDFVLKEMKFKSIKTSILNLIKIGAFDSINENAKALCSFYEEWCSVKARMRKKDPEKVVQLAKEMWRKYKDLGDYEKGEKRLLEGEICKFNIFHGADESEEKKIEYLKDRKKIVTCHKQAKSGQFYLGILEALKYHIDKRGKEMCFYTIEDWEKNSNELISFADTYQEMKHVKIGDYYLIKGHIRDTEPSKGSIQVDKQGDFVVPLKRLKNI